MKKLNPDVCPGCSKHCARDSVRCKHGRAYFAERSAPEPKPLAKAGKLYKKRKWEKYVTENGLAWKMIFVGMRAKKALRRGEITENGLMNVLDEQEKLQLVQILKKLNERLK